MKKKQFKTKTLFSVDLTLYKDGRVELTDVQGVVYDVRNKDDTNLTEAQYEDIVNKQFSFWQMVKRYKLVILQGGK